MGWVLFEVLLAFGLAVFIVWWTFPKGEDNAAPGPQTGKEESDRTPPPQ